jgi:hypothetical protein
MLRPSIVVIYDELEADHTAQWSWLLHNDTGLEINPGNHTITAKNEAAKAMVSLYSSTATDFTVTDQFSVPVDNWTKKTNEEGDTIDFNNQWHFKSVSKEKRTKMRYMAIIQVKPDGGFEQVFTDKKEGLFTVGNWNIDAEMNTSKPAVIRAWRSDNSASMVSEGNLVLNGKTFNGKEFGSSKLLEIMDGKEIFQEAEDEIPASVQKVMKYID